MTNEINNCGLVALRNISDLKSVSVRTLINLAEDNGLKLYPYKLTENEIEKAELPAIFHSDNHFVYIVDRDDLKRYNITGEVLFTKEQPYSPIQYDKTHSITGEWVAAGVASAALTLAAAKWISGNSKEKKAKRERDRLAKPFYKVQKEYYENKNLASSLAQGGLPEASKDYYTNESQRGLSAGIKGILGSGGNPNDIQGLFDAYDNGIGKIGVADAEAQINNIKYYMGVNKDLAGQKTIQWAINKQQPYLNTLKELNAAQAAGEATKNQALNDAMSTVTSFGTSMAGGSGAGGFGKQSGGGASLSSLSNSAYGGEGRGHSLGGGLNGYGGTQELWAAGNNNINNTPSVNTDPFGNDQNEYADYLKWKQFNGQ